MQIESIQLKHILHFSDIQLNFEYHDLPITLILGAQSSGKTTLLRFSFQALTWFAARYKDLRTAGVVMLDQDIMQTRLQSKMDIRVRFAEEIGQLSESSATQQLDVHTCSWQLYKTLNQRGVGISKAETQQLEALVALYQKALQQDSMQGLPLIAYYPAERFVHDINLISKNNPAIFQSHYAYDISAIPFTMFSRFFEWFREISDIENAQTAHLVQQLLKQHHSNEEFFFSQKLADSYAQMTAPALKALNTALNTVIPDLHHLYLDFQPKLQLMVHYQGKNMLYSQLSNSIRCLIALVGDIVRRLCLLNPNSLYPCQEGDGILLIDAIDHHLDADWSSIILLRLHAAFPRLQIIASGQREELLENAEAMQCLRLEQKQLHTIQGQYHFDEVYEQLALSPDEDNAEKISSNQPVEPDIYAWQQQIQQQLSDAQQQQLIHLLQDSNPEQQNIHLPEP